MGHYTSVWLFLVASAQMWAGQELHCFVPIPASPFLFLVGGHCQGLSLPPTASLQPWGVTSYQLKPLLPTLDHQEGTSSTVTPHKGEVPYPYMSSPLMVPYKLFFVSAMPLHSLARG